MTVPYPPVPGGGYSTFDPHAGYGGQGGYGQSAYGAPGGYGAYGAVPGRRPVLVANPAGILIALLGGIAVLIGAFVDWYTDVQLGDIVNSLDVDGAKAFPKAYFGWLMWVLLAATVVAALLAALPLPASGALRVIAPVLGLLGAVLVVVSLNELIQRGSVFDHSAAGLYLVLLGFVVAGVGGALGPRRSRS